MNLKLKNRSLAVLALSLALPIGARAQDTGANSIPPKPAPFLQSAALPRPNAAKPLLRSPGAKELGDLVKDRALTIDDAVAIALATNRGFAAALENLEAARAQTAVARTQLNPRAEASGQLTQYDRSVTADFGGQTLVLTNAYNPVYVTSVSLPIDLFGSIRASVNQAQFREVAAKIDVNRARNETVFSVRNAFFTALRAQGQLVVAQDNLTNSQARLHDAEALLRVGIGTQFDVLTAQRDVADAQQSVVQTKGQVTLALGQLKSVMGIDVSVPIRIVDTGAVEVPGGSAPELPSVQPSEPGTPPARAEASERFHSVQNEVALGPEYAAAVDEALMARPEVLESEATLSAARQGIAYARRTELPSISLSASYVVQPHNAGFTPEHQASVALGLTVPIFDGGLASANVRAARAAVASAEVQQRNTIDQVTLDVQQAYVNVVQARERVLVANLALTQAREAFRLARVRASAGVTATPQASPELELSNAQTTLTQAETNRVNALYDYNVARSQLQRSMGRYSYGVGPGFENVPTKRETGRK